MINEEDIEMIGSFVSESYDLIDAVEPLLIGLKDCDEAADRGTIDSVFRLFHSMKGAAGFLKMENVASVTHHAETLLDVFRRKAIPMNSYYIGVELSVVDALREMLSCVEMTNTDAGMEKVRDTALASMKEAMAKLESRAASPAPAPASEPSIDLGDPPAKSAAAVDAASAANAERAFIARDLPPALLATTELITPEMAVRFSQESNEVIDSAEQSLLGLEDKPEEERAASLNEIFRLIHSFKGNCGFMQLAEMERLSHKMESALDGMRSKSVPVTAQNIDVLVKAMDMLRSGLASYSKGEGGHIFNCDLLLEFLDDMFPKADGSADDGASAVNAVNLNVAVNANESTQAQQPSPLDLNKNEKDVSALNKSGQESQGEQKFVRKDIRVDLEKLDNLINLVGELVVAEAMVLRNRALIEIEDESLERAVHHLRRVSESLQDTAMSVRMIPLAATFKKMIRLVHDLSIKSGKKVGIELIGEETEVDKNVIEQINDPLVHIIRNSVDHGIETAEERIRLGKPEKGTVSVEAKHDGGEVLIIVHDDGKGLNRERIIKKGLEKGLVKGDPAQMSDDEVYSLIFEPGFSTADKLTDISGRGVGMDVVKRNIEKLNGRVCLKTVPGSGTSVVIHIPLTLAIIDGMLVRVGDNQYAVPLLSVREALRPMTRMVTSRPDGMELIRMRDELIPVLRLHKVYNKANAVTDLEKAIMVIVESDAGTAALMVDEIIGQHQIVIKGLSSYFGNPMGISGCAILGDGRVGLIIDVGALLRDVVKAR